MIRSVLYQEDINAMVKLSKHHVSKRELPMIPLVYLDAFLELHV
eukprot:CAMPEP_0114265820 /NCGR_PEP_ID=MMETSP0058-20121206/24189_1 /TAXON_ID=36894 /ORGANISM="Pyramimonas parkeae, CCMP726" /LENGTH=43 /DNA_ID= /DNA_START= /DNA_END= /DNA_ORIENTATION=